MLQEIATLEFSAVGNRTFCEHRSPLEAAIEDWLAQPGGKTEYMLCILLARELERRGVRGRDSVDIARDAMARYVLRNGTVSRGSLGVNKPLPTAQVRISSVQVS